MVSVGRCRVSLGLLLSAGACAGPSIIADSADSSSTTGDDPALSTGPGVTTLVPDSTGTTSGMASGTTVGVTTLTADSSSGPPPSDSTSTGDLDTSSSSTTDSTSTGAESTTDTGGVNPGGLPNGSQCSDDMDCFSDECFVQGALGGVCGECTTDSDCAGGGCSAPNPLTSQPAVCNQGEIGDGCQTSAVCADDLLCNQILDIPMILQASTCGECVDDADCDGADTCQPDYVVADLTGHWACVAQGSILDGGGCDLDAGTGNGACASGACAPANFMNFLELGVCSECVDDADCPGAQQCQPAEIDLAKGLAPAFCL